jgi:FkbM family methyltransferase
MKVHGSAAVQRLGTGHRPPTRTTQALISLAQRSPVARRSIASLWRRGLLPSPSGTVRRRTANGAVMELDLDDRTQRAMALGRFEPQETAYVRAKLRPGDVFVDVGAHVGWFAAMAGLLVGDEGRVYAVEPFPLNVAKLRTNLELNGVHATIAEAVASDVEGRSDVGQQQNGDSGSVTAGPRAHNEVVSVRCAPLDTLLPRAEPIRLLKIDVEGGEATVLAGAAQTLSRTENLLVELNASALASRQSSPEEVMRQLESSGFVQESVFTYPHAPHFTNVALSRSTRRSANA